MAAYDNVTIGTPGGLPAAPSSLSPCSSNWSCSDIGNPARVGDQTLNNNTLTLKGAGLDIWGVADQFRFVWQQMAGNSTISAHILTQQHTDPLAKAGVMLRTSMDANAPYYAAFVTPSHGISMQSRAKRGDNTNEVLLPDTNKAPVYLKVTRVGDTFTAYTSQDDVTWTPIAGSTATIDMGPSVLAELAVTSHNISYLSVVTFDTVSINAP